MTGSRLRVGVYDLYWSTLGGGEQVDGSIAQVLAGRSRRDAARPAPRRRRRHVPPARRRPVGLRPPPRRRRRRGERGERRLRRVRQRHVPEQGDQPGAARLLLRPLPGRCRTPGRSRPQPDGRRRREGAVARRRELPQRLTEVQAGVRPSRRAGSSSSPPTAATSPTRVHRRLGRAALGRADRRAVPAGPTERATGGEGAADPRARPVLRPEVRPQQEAARTARDVPSSCTASGRLPRLADGDRRRLRRRRPRLRARRAASGASGCRSTCTSTRRARSSSSCSASASIYWHGAGLGEDPQRHPERFEHFGISRRRGDGRRRRTGRVRCRRPGRDRPRRCRRSPLAHARPARRSDRRARRRRRRRRVAQRVGDQRAGDFSAAAFADRLRSLLAADTGSRAPSCRVFPPSGDRARRCDCPTTEYPTADGQTT